MPLQITVIAARDLLPGKRQEIIDLCTEAYEEDFAPILALFPDAMHLLARLDGKLVSHACWVTRWLQPDRLPPLKTAYVEAVATAPAYQGKGFGSNVMQRVAAEIQGYTLGGLCAARVHTGLYKRLGWETWRGPRAIRTSDALIETPGEDVMILRTALAPLLAVNTTITAEWREGELW